MLYFSILMLIMEFISRLRQEFFILFALVKYIKNHASLVKFKKCKKGWLESCAGTLQCYCFVMVVIKENDSFDVRHLPFDANITGNRTHELIYFRFKSPNAHFYFTFLWFFFLSYRFNVVTLKINLSQGGACFFQILVTVCNTWRNVTIACYFHTVKYFDNCENNSLWRFNVYSMDKTRYFTTECVIKTFI